MAFDYNLTNSELSGQQQPEDKKGLLGNIETDGSLNFIARKRKAQKRPNIDPQLTKLILWYIGCAAFWLLFGTTIGGPQSQWDLVIISVTAVIVLATLFFSIKFLVKPGEKSVTHIKRFILNNE